MKLFKSANVCIPAFFALAYGDTCYDGNNNGCSHDCSAGVCSCPPCWTLGADGKTCQFESGKAQVTCSANGAEIKIAKCAVPGVDPSAITLTNECVAIEDSGNADFWRISTGFQECGSTFDYNSDVEKLQLSNTLVIGKPTVSGRVTGRQYNIDFACNFNNVATASSSINAVNTPFNEVTFDIDSTQPTDLSFAFDLAFYESGAFVTAADLSNGAFQPGSSLFGRVAPTDTLPGAFEFSVSKCTVVDPAISQSLDILDTCPAPETNFVFADSQSDTTNVKFSFESFTFPASADDVVLDVNCEVNVCPENSAECLNICETTPDSGDSSDGDSSDDSINLKDHLLYIGQSISKAFVLNDDGTTRAAGLIIPDGLTSSRSYSYYSAFSYDDNTPNGANFLYQSVSAIVNGQVYFFGGMNDADSALFKIATLNGCEIVELEARLTRQFDEASSALAINGGSEALICWAWYNPFEGCNIFDGTSARDTYASNASHLSGGLAYYNGKPTSVSSTYVTGHRKVESFGENGWEYLPDFPKNIFGHKLVGLESGDMFVIGGKNRPDDSNPSTLEYHNEVLRMSAHDGSVTSVGDLLKNSYRGAVLAIDNSIYVVDSYYSRQTNTIQRIDLNDWEDIERIEFETTFSQTDAYYHTPMLLAVEADFCQA